MNYSAKILSFSLFFLLSLLVISSLSLCFGIEFISIKDLLNPSFHTIIWELRFPRILLAILVGGALTTSGSVLQVVLKNPLADPYILGISGASAFGAALAFMLHLPYSMISLFSFGSSLVALFIIIKAAQKHTTTSSPVLLLTGVLLSFLFSAFVSLFLTLAAPFEGAKLLFWLMGGFSYPFPLSFILVSLLAVIVIFSLIYLKSYALNLFNLSEENAKTLGVNIVFTKNYFFILSSLLTSISVALAGMIGFVGFIIPHITRLFLGGDLRLTLPINFLLGSLFLVLVDSFIRTAFTQEIPIGAITALIGAPLFLAFLWKGGKGKKSL